MTSPTQDLLYGIADLIAGAGLGIDWDPDAAYTADQTAIVMKNMAASPDRLVVLNLVNQGDNPSLPLGQVMLQVRGRGLPGQPLDVDNLLDGIFGILHGRTNFALGSVFVNQINRRIRVPNGMDESKRWELIDQYYADVDFPPTINRPAGGSW